MARMERAMEEANEEQSTESDADDEGSLLLIWTTGTRVISIWTLTRMDLVQLTKTTVGWSTLMLTLSSPQMTTWTTMKKKKKNSLGLVWILTIMRKTATGRKMNPIHLPDNLFTAAFAPRAKAVVVPGDVECEAKGKRRKKRKTGASAKDVVLGSRILRTLPSTTQSRPTPALQPKKNKKFLERVLALKGTSKSKGKRWERRAANVGVMR
ncbi:hypothetical protein BDQ17DRAFT_1369694, partial [Cyathus striatus]